MSRHPFMSGSSAGGQPDHLSATALTGHDGVMESLETDAAVGTTADQEARFHSLFTQNYENVLRYCLRRLPGPDANDATSEVFVVAWRRIDTVPAGEDSRLWLYGIARNVVRNSRRSARRAVWLRTKVAGLAPETVDGPERQVVQSDELRHALAAVDRLSAKDQEVLRLRAMERLEIEEIASVLDCSVEAARKRFDRASQRLQSKVGSPVPAKPILPCEHEGEVTA
ncbi:MAG: RNA polymerase sigma factor [Acidimicrobiia bacterium]